MPHLVILDSCVLVNAAIRDTLLRAAELDFYRPLWSQEILDELRRAITEQLLVPEPKADYLLSRLNEYFPEACVRGYESLIPVMSVDEGDKHVAAAAVRGRADVIVTFDLGDFPQASLDPYDIEVQSPDEFLEHLYHLETDAMVAIIVEQARDMTRRPLTPIDLCSRLRAQGVPSFASLIEEKLVP